MLKYMIIASSDKINTSIQTFLNHFIDDIIIFFNEELIVIIRIFPKRKYFPKLNEKLLEFMANQLMDNFTLFIIHIII